MPFRIMSTIRVREGGGRIGDYGFDSTEALEGVLARSGWIPTKTGGWTVSSLCNTIYTAEIVLVYDPRDIQLLPNYKE